MKPKITCYEKDCQETDNLTHCRLTMYRRDMPWYWYLKTYGLRGFVYLWQLLRDGWVDLTEYYCAEHCHDNGFCFNCGGFWAGAESFDFGPGWCSNCASEFEETEYEDEEYWGQHYDMVDYYDENTWGTGE